MQSQKEEIARIREAYKVLESIRHGFFDLKNKFDLEVSLADIQKRWGEYYVANELIGAGMKQVWVQKRGADIVSQQGRVEVKTSRSTQRFKPGGKNGYGWAVKKEQWQAPGQFDYLVCVLADTDSPVKTLAFTRGEVVELFTKATFTRSNTRKREHDAKRLDLIEGGLKAFEANQKTAKKALKWEGTPTKFEQDFNENRDPVFQKYSMKRMFRMMKDRAS
jgi:hypothetical protein